MTLQKFFRFWTKMNCRKVWLLAWKLFICQLRIGWCLTGFILQDNKIHVYSLSGNSLTESKVLEHNGGLTDLKYSPDGSFLAACDTFRKVYLYKLPDYAVSASLQSQLCCCCMKKDVVCYYFESVLVVSYGQQRLFLLYAVESDTTQRICHIALIFISNLFSLCISETVVWAVHSIKQCFLTLRPLTAMRRRKRKLWNTVVIFDI